MAMDKVGPVGGAGGAPAVEPRGERFGRVLEDVRPRVAVEGPPRPAPVEAAGGVARVEAGCTEVKPGGRVDSVQAAREQHAAQVLDRVAQAQRRLDHILELAESGRNFTPAELLALQAHVYRSSQELDLAGKVVEKATGGVKQVLQTQV
jgi:hypothetical protein